MDCYTVILGIIIGLIFILAIKFVLSNMKEQFENKQEKASAISSWWGSQKNPSFANYSKQVPHSDVVEYRSIKQAATGGAPVTPQLVEKLI